jgi:hypothetical protein
MTCVLSEKTRRLYSCLVDEANQEDEALVEGLYRGP